VLGDNQNRRAESMDDLRQRIRRQVSIFHLRSSGSARNGFAKSVLNNSISFEEEKEKLELVVRTAHEVWG
jgi:5-methyltetrahydropteroyltriglutamate--homocysteine methyltransferase